MEYIVLGEHIGGSQVDVALVKTQQPVFGRDALGPVPPRLGSQVCSTGPRTAPPGQSGM